MRDALDGVGLAVREIVHRIDAPLVARAVMFGVQNAVHHRIAHVQVLRSHIDLGAQGTRADRKSTRLNSSHLGISYAVFCLKKKKNQLLMRRGLALRSHGPVSRLRSCWF